MRKHPEAAVSLANSQIEKKVLFAGITGVFVGALSIIACELPLILALVGLGGLGSTATTWSIDPRLEMAGIGVGIGSLVCMLLIMIYRWRNRR